MREFLDAWKDNKEVNREYKKPLRTLWRASGYLFENFELDDDDKFVLALEVRRALLLLEDDLALQQDFSLEDYHTMTSKTDEILKLTDSIVKFRNPKKKKWYKKIRLKKQKKTCTNPEGHRYIIGGVCEFCGEKDPNH